MTMMVKKAATAAPAHPADELICDAADDAYTFIAMAASHIDGALRVTAMEQARRAVAHNDAGELMRMMKRTLAAQQKLRRLERDMMLIVQDCEREGG